MSIECREPDDPEHRQVLTGTGDLPECSASGQFCLSCRGLLKRISWLHMEFGYPRSRHWTWQHSSHCPEAPDSSLFCAWLLGKGPAPDYALVRDRWRASSPRAAVLIPPPNGERHLRIQGTSNSRGLEIRNDNCFCNNILKSSSRPGRGFGAVLLSGRH